MLTLSADRWICHRELKRERKVIKKSSDDGENCIMFPTDLELPGNVF